MRRASGAPSTRAGPREIRSRSRTARPRWRRATRSERNARAGLRATGAPTRRLRRDVAPGTSARPQYARLPAVSRRWPITEQSARLAQVGHRAGDVDAVGLLQASIVPSGDQVGEATAAAATTQRSAGSAGGGWLTPNRWISFPPRDRASRGRPRGRAGPAERRAVVVGEPALVAASPRPTRLTDDGLPRADAVAEQQRAARAVPRRLAALAHDAELERVGHAVGERVGGDVGVLQRAAASVGRQKRRRPVNQ